MSERVTLIPLIIRDKSTLDIIEGDDKLYIHVIDLDKSSDGENKLKNPDVIFKEIQYINSNIETPNRILGLDLDFKEEELKLNNDKSLNNNFKINLQIEATTGILNFCQKINNQLAINEIKSKSFNFNEKFPKDDEYFLKFLWFYLLKGSYDLLEDYSIKSILTCDYGKEEEEGDLEIVITNKNEFDITLATINLKQDKNLKIDLFQWFDLSIQNKNYEKNLEIIKKDVLKFLEILNNKKSKILELEQENFTTNENLKLLNKKRLEKDKYDLDKSVIDITDLSNEIENANPEITTGIDSLPQTLGAQTVGPEALGPQTAEVASPGTPPLPSPPRKKMKFKKENDDYAERTRPLSDFKNSSNADQIIVNQPLHTFPIKPAQKKNSQSSSKNNTDTADTDTEIDTEYSS
ncbi:hypothetical protein PACTADRAFT_51741 [Pachysolen tannophilus NRRL Y-2460]|uniref:Uncharacterized protein n=1 Tax=Pachysolen tannophilus NRRL Y-2460 TaxID=669874 RepID=A0A1E4TQI3_PACTA|nr:hypothetical protein PACTADRAFT_51741 [Pachysolen tannophilus NRRL Y-2460]